MNLPEEYFPLLKNDTVGSHPVNLKSCRYFKVFLLAKVFLLYMCLKLIQSRSFAAVGTGALTPDNAKIYLWPSGFIWPVSNIVCMKGESFQSVNGISSYIQLEPSAKDGLLGWFHLVCLAYSIDGAEMWIQSLFFFSVSNGIETKIRGEIMTLLQSLAKLPLTEVRLGSQPRVSSV